MMKKVNSFTILETTIVLATMSILVTIIMLATNRFNEQLKNNISIQQELNTFYAFRSNLWRELYASDSVDYQHETITIYKNNRPILYTIENNELLRKAEKEWVNTGFPMIELKKEIENEDKIVYFVFDWKGEPMKLSYLCRAEIQQKIDNHFANFSR